MTQNPPATRRVLLLGSNGQLGRELAPILGVGHDLVALGRAEADLSRPDRLRAIIEDARPEIIVNAAAYTQVDKAESEPALAATVNAEAVGVIAAAARELGALLVHYSTDYVFDGSGRRPWTEDDVPAPLGVYGATKLAGEQAIAASGCANIVLRVSWLYGRHGKNFLKTMLALAATKTELRVVADQIGAPTSVSGVAEATAAIIPSAIADGARRGLFHLAAAGAASWHDYATLVIETARTAGLPVTVEAIVPVPTSDYPTPARRPLNSRLDTSRLAGAFGIGLPDWREDVISLVHQLARA